MNFASFMMSMADQSLVTQSAIFQADKSEKLAQACDTLSKAFMCPICLCSFTDPQSTPCGHIFCKECIMNALNNGSFCPLCRFVH